MTKKHSGERVAGPLSGVRVLDAATLFAGPMAGMLLADFGADVIKIEHPKGDPVRNHGHEKNGINLWWKMLSRNKRTVSCNLSTDDGRRLMLRLVETADVLIENFRPGTLERWNLAPDLLLEVNPNLVIARVTGFGQFGPYAARPGFGTLAESMSGFAAITGDPSGPPVLPPFGLADGIAALATANAIQMCLYNRDVNGGSGQIIDLAIIEPIVSVLGPQPMWYDQLGIIQERTGNRSVNNAPRNTYRTKDGRWVAVSTSAQNIAERVMRLVHHPEVIDEPWFATGIGRAEHADLLDSYVGGWIARYDLDDVVKLFDEAEAAVAPIYDIAQIFDDPQYQALDTITSVDDPDFGTLRMQNVMFRLSTTPGGIAWTGHRIGEDNEDVYGELGIEPEELELLANHGAI
jgi:crotonobetainyl-CoA:carnitine CoA-transferase CaiB-like acyl-CoA transferase